jgi:putative ABC transport system substrate-binding protein
MKRRKFITLLGGAAVAGWPLSARAQQPAMPVIGFLQSASSEAEISVQELAAFRQGLAETGYVEGRNVAIEYRWAEGRNDRLPAMAADLVRRQVAVIVANGPAVLAAKPATAAISIVFFTGSDPVALGLVASLNRPGGNLTGVTTLNTAVEPKRLELLHELVPTASTIAVLVNPTGPSAEPLLRELQAAAATQGVQLLVLRASTEKDISMAFATLVQQRAGALLIGNDAFFSSQADRLAALTIRHSVPAIYQYAQFTAAGGLISYGASIIDAFRVMGVYTGRILKGEKPGNLPVQQSDKIELIINLKTAKALGLTVPPHIVARADEVIE